MGVYVIRVGSICCERWEFILQELGNDVRRGGPVLRELGVYVIRVGNLCYKSWGILL